MILTKRSQNEFVGMAMAQAGKLYDEKQSSGKVHGEAKKQDAVHEAAETALKMYMKSEMGGGKHGESGGGGGGGLLSMASKFL